MVLLVGDPDLRPAGLERDLLRAGFQVAETDDPSLIPGRPALVVVTCRSLAPDCSDLVSGLASARPSGAQVVVLLPEGTPDDLIRAAEAGADDAILLPSESGHLVARLIARVVSPRVVASGPAGNDLRLFDVLQQVAVELHRDDMLHALVVGLARTLEVRSVACLLHASGVNVGRLVAASDARMTLSMVTVTSGRSSFWGSDVSTAWSRPQSIKAPSIISPAIPAEGSITAMREDFMGSISHRPPRPAMWANDTTSRSRY